MYKKSRKIIAIAIAIAIAMAIVIAMRRESFTAVEQDVKGLNRLDAIIYINLDTRTDRKREIESELERMGVDKTKIIRFPAVYEKYNGHLGCAKSHLAVIQLIKNSDYQNALIIEDDFLFTGTKENVNSSIDYFFDNYKKWDCVSLVGSFQASTKIDDKIHKVKYHTGSIAYIVNNNGFYDKLEEDLQSSVNKLTKNRKKFIQKHGEKKKQYTDSNALNQHWGTLQKKSNWYIFIPHLGKHNNNASSNIMQSI